MTLTRSLVEHNTAVAYLGGGIYKHDYGTGSLPALMLRDSRVYSNSAGTNGGGLAGLGRADVWRSAFEQNRSAGGVGGGGVHFSGTVSLDFSRLSENSAAANGGGLYLAGGFVTGWANTFAGNAAAGKGGGLAQYGGQVSLYYSTFSSNRAEVYGGGVHHEAGILRLGNVTVSGNSAGQHGGGLFTADSLTLTQVTIANNQAPMGGGLSRSAGVAPFELYNTLLADNLASSASAGNCWGPNSTSAFSLSTDGTCGFGPERSNVNAALGPLRVNGGIAPYRTLTHLPLAGSAAIDAGSSSYCIERDQRWAARPVGLACDVGAVESGAVVPWVWLAMVQRQ
jgi:predicted outer membrane repeat protein